MLKRAVECVLNQTFKDFVHVIVNDTGDKTTLEELIKPYLSRYNGRIIILHRTSSTGMESATNYGIYNSSSQWIALLDDDDTWENQYLERMLFEANNPPLASVQGVACWIDKITEAEDTNGGINHIKTTPYIFGHLSISIYDLCQKNKILPTGFIYSRKAYIDIGPYDEEFPVLGDWDFHIRFMELFNIRVIPEILAHYHVRPKATGSSGNSITRGLDLHRVYRAFLLNKHFRRDLALGRPGLGMMLNAAASTQEAFDGWMAIVKVMKALFPYLPGKSWFLRG